MKWLFFSIFYHIFLFEVDCKFLSLIHQLNMENPIIVGKTSELRSREMFQMIKDIMRLNQTISATTTIKNNSLINSPGIILQPNKYEMKDFYSQKSRGYV